MDRTGQDIGTTAGSTTRLPPSQLNAANANSMIGGGIGNAGNFRNAPAGVGLGTGGGLGLGGMGDNFARRGLTEMEMLTKPTCETLKGILVYSNWLLLVVTTLLMIGIFANWTSGITVFLALVSIILAMYTVYVNTKWPDVEQCVLENRAAGFAQ